MSSKTTTNDIGAKVATGKNPKTGNGKKPTNSTAHYELLSQEEAVDNSGATVSEAVPENATVSAIEGTVTDSAEAVNQPVKASKKASQKKAVSKAKTVVAQPAKAKSEKPSQKKAVVKGVATQPAKATSNQVAHKKADSNSKSAAPSNKKIRLAASTYHYYRNWLAEFMRSHGVPSARFQKAPESYNGHILIAEAEKAKGLKALEQWTKQNPDTKELFWDIKK